MNSYLRKIKLLNRKKTDPNKFFFTGDERDQISKVQLYQYTPDKAKELQDLSLSEFDHRSLQEPISWLNIFGLSNTNDIVSFCQQHKIDNLVIQDILDVNQRPKFQAYEHYNFLTIKSTVPSEKLLEVEQISFVFNSNYLISFQEKKADHFDHIRYRIKENKGIIRKEATDFLLYTLLEAILDNYFKTLERINNEVDQLNIKNLKTNPSPSALEDIEEQKVVVRFIKNAILPIKEFTMITERGHQSFIQARNKKFYYELKDLSQTLLDHCDTLQASLESSTNLLFSIQSHKMNQVMKTLTVVSTIFIPLTFIAGIYGMNFENMPELGWQYGYYGVWGIIFIIFIGMLIFFKRKNWF